MGAVFLGYAHGVQIDHEGWLAVSDAIDWVCEHWDQPDEGIWEPAAARTSPMAGSNAGSPWTGRSGWPADTGGQQT